MQKKKPAKNLTELALQLLDKQTAFDNGEYEKSALDTSAKVATVVTGMFKLQWEKNQVEGVKEKIAFLEMDYATKDLPPAQKGLKSEFFESGYNEAKKIAETGSLK